MKVQESREDYLEAILILSQRQDMVRSVDVANHLGFSKPSVSVAVGNLKSALLLTVDGAGGLHLTEAGKALAELVYERHRLLTQYLIDLGVDPVTAAEDACRMEHVISQITFEKFKERAKQYGSNAQDAASDS
ncbi:metal-dependent transcriptional regulator [Eubacteriales bacterium OttesenSCG-928-A19]|nr:metal-dependent transcriptional regulator [Eubacteriales bacterium OttesenSCG-928-A19]